MIYFFKLLLKSPPLTKGALILLIILSFLFAGCSSTKSPYSRAHDGKPKDFEHFDADSIPDPVPKSEPRSKYGNPASYEVFGKRYHVLDTADGYAETGLASWYGIKFHEARTSSGESYNMYEMTAAHKTLPLPTYARVTNLQNNKSIVVKVNDRGPFISKRIIDLSFVAAKKLDITQTGTALVKVEAINPFHPNELEKNTEVYLQLGAFNTVAAAEELVNKIKAITSRSTYIVASEAGNNILHKVQLGPLSGAHEIESLKATFKRNGLGNVFTVVR